MLRVHVADPVGAELELELLSWFWSLVPESKIRRKKKIYFLCAPYNQMDGFHNTTEVNALYDVQKKFDLRSALSWDRVFVK